VSKFRLSANSAPASHSAAAPAALKSPLKALGAPKTRAASADEWVSF